MYYEGYVQRICDRGHYFTVDAYSDSGVCDCGSSTYVAENHVDITNGCIYDGMTPCRCGAKDVLFSKDSDCTKVKAIGFGMPMIHHKLESDPEDSAAQPRANRRQFLESACDESEDLPYPKNYYAALLDIAEDTGDNELAVILRVRLRKTLGNLNGRKPNI